MKTNSSLSLLILSVMFSLLAIISVQFHHLASAQETILLDAPPDKLPNYLLKAPVINALIANTQIVTPSASENKITEEKPAQNPSESKNTNIIPSEEKTQPEKSDNNSAPSQKKSATSDSESSENKQAEVKPADDKNSSSVPSSNKRGRNHQCIPPKEYPIGDIPLEILDYNKLTLPAICSKADPETAEDLIELEKHVQKISAEVLAATVCVRAGGGSGSGVVISEDGWILTAAHVCIKPGRTFSVIFPDGKSVKAITYGTNHEDDAGLMKILDAGKWPHAGVAAIPIDESAWTLCTGHPGGMMEDRPPVLRLGRVIRSCQHVVRTDNLIMPGDSGGPVFDMHGRVVAINSRIGPSQSLNYHVPAWVFLRDWDRLEKKESWGSDEDASDNRGFLGVELERGADEAKIKSIMPGLPAEKAELKIGDVILDVNGREVRSFEDLIGYLSRKKVGDKVTLKVKRGNEEFTREIILAEPPNE
jgi:serine protease Do